MYEVALEIPLTPFVDKSELSLINTEIETGVPFDDQNVQRIVITFSLIGCAYIEMEI